MSFKIAILAAASSIHTVRWVNALVERGHQVLLISQHTPHVEMGSEVVLASLPFASPLGYILNAPFIKRRLHRFNPDIFHVHYASGYGTLARLSGCRPSLLSVWGSDVYEFPASSPLKRQILEANLAFADQIASTSKVMAEHTKQYMAPERDIWVTPFGIDTDVFHPFQQHRTGFCMGTIKTLAPKYGIDILIRAFALARYQGLPTQAKLLLVGGGPQEKELKRLCIELQIQEQVIFTGRVPHEQIPRYLNQLDLYLALSTTDSESFGVAILEASAVALPVIVSNVGGLAEVVKDRETGFIVPMNDIEAAAQKVCWIYHHAEAAKKMGELGRQHVLANYTWAYSVELMESLYKQIVQLNHRQ